MIKPEKYDQYIATIDLVAKSRYKDYVVLAEPEEYVEVVSRYNGRKSKMPYKVYLNEVARRYGYDSFEELVRNEELDVEECRKEDAPEKGYRYYMGRKDNYDGKGHYDDSDYSLVYITDKDRVAELLYTSEYTLSQQELLDKGIFTADDYTEYYKLLNTELKQFVEEKPLHFNDRDGEEAEAFSYPLKDHSKESKEEEQQAVSFRRKGR